MHQYQELLRAIKRGGKMRMDRTNTGTTGVFGAQMRFNLQEGFPLVTTKFVPFKLVIAELLWFLSGSTNNNDLVALNCHIWDEWAREDGSLGPIYGAQWRFWGGFDHKDGTRAYGVDQISDLVRGLRENPDSRRHIVSAWNPTDIGKMALPPCHALFQFNSETLSFGERLRAADRSLFTIDALRAKGLATSAWHDPNMLELTAYMDSFGVPKRGLSCQLYQRSADMFLGVPFNIASYAALTMMVAQQTDHIPLDFIWTGGDCHVYLNHTEQVDTLLSRKPLALPKLVIAKAEDIFSYKPESFVLQGYDPLPAIPAPVAV